jgi:hypothetical protein
MRYWMSFGLLLGAALIVAISLLWAVLGLPLLFVVLITAAGYGILVALNLVPPGRPGRGGVLGTAPSVDATRDRANPLADPNFAHHYRYDPDAYDPFEAAHAYWEDPYADDARIAATPIVLASIGLLAVAFLGVAAAAIEWGIGGGPGQPHAPVGAVLGEEAPTVTTPVASATSTATAVPTRLAPVTAIPTDTATTAATATTTATTPATNTPRSLPTSTPTTRPATSTPVPPTATKPKPTTPPTSAPTSAATSPAQATSGAGAQSTSGATAQSTSGATSAPTDDRGPNGRGNRRRD